MNVATMRRGFKSQAEEIAIRCRQQMHMPEIAPIAMTALAKHLEVAVMTPEDIPGLAEAGFEIINNSNGHGWSALCMSTRSGYLIIHNSTHSTERQESNIAHELSHIICKHKPDRFVEIGASGLMVRTFDHEQEEEAKYLGGCLHLPRKALLHCLFRGMDEAEIAAAYHASTQMVCYRLNVTGARTIFSRAGKKPWRSRQRVGENGISDALCHRSADALDQRGWRGRLKESRVLEVGAPQESARE
ncbi:MAG: ImmA/IrrE family metallo-endopeptidase [Terrimicrobiaceae bacterium]